ncbi:MAG: hypothetical protein QOD07_3133 [Frankiaceae bacterium]|nr:hypothetical protein [Frankiaceae bacterium]
MAGIDADGTRTYLDVAATREYVDDEGIRWRRRGALLEGKTLQRRTMRPEVIVRRHYLGSVTEIPGEARAEFWAAVQTRLAESRHASVVGAEFVDRIGRHLVLVDESC